MKHYRRKGEDFKIYVLKPEYDTESNVNSIKRNYGLGKMFKGYELFRTEYKLVYMVRLINQHGKQQDKKIDLGFCSYMYEEKQKGNK